MGVADLYIFRRVFWPLLAVTAVVFTVVSLWQLTRVSRMVLMNWRDVALLSTIIMDLAPTFAAMALGTSGIFGCVVAYDRLAEDGELTAMSASAISPQRIFRPAMLAGLTMASLVLAAGIWGEPWGSSRYGRDVATLGTRSFARTLKSGTFNQVGDLASVYVEDAQVNTDGHAVLKHVVVGRDLPQGPVVLTAEEVTVDPVGPGLLRIETSAGEALLPAGKPQDLHRMTFEKAAVTVDVASWLGEATMTLRDFQSWELAVIWAEADNEQSQQPLAKLRFHLWQKFTLPWGMLVLCLLGGLLGGQRAPTARGRAYIASALLVAAYFGLLGFGRNLTIQGAVPAWVGPNIPNLLVTALLAWLWKTRATRWS